MTRKAKSVLTEALSLSDKERRQVLNGLLKSLSVDANNMTDEEFYQELLRREAEVDAGVAELTPWSELRKER